MKTLVERVLFAVMIAMALVSCGPDINPEQEDPAPVVPAPEPEPEPDPIPEYNGIKVVGRKSCGCRG